MRDGVSVRLVRQSLLTGLLLVALAAAPADGLPPTPPGPTKAKRALVRLKIAPDGPRTGYSRAKFGSGWARSPGGCDTRKRVLLRDGQEVLKGASCKIIAGRWHSFYDDKVFSAPGKLDIDHVIPLAEAWRSGARGWSAAERKRFANDLAEPQLVAVSASSNRSKGDKGPEEWKPRRAAWCLYARWWVRVKTAWRLTVTGAEKRELRSMLNTC